MDSDPCVHLAQCYIDWQQLSWVSGWDFSQSYLEMSGIELGICMQNRFLPMSYSPCPKGKLFKLVTLNPQHHTASQNVALSYPQCAKATIIILFRILGFFKKMYGQHVYGIKFLQLSDVSLCMYQRVISFTVFFAP